MGSLAMLGLVACASSAQEDSEESSGAIEGEDPARETPRDVELDLCTVSSLGYGQTIRGSAGSSIRFTQNLHPNETRRFWVSGPNHAVDRVSVTVTSGERSWRAPREAQYYLVHDGRTGDMPFTVTVDFAADAELAANGCDRIECTETGCTPVEEHFTKELGACSLGDRKTIKVACTSHSLPQEAVLACKEMCTGPAEWCTVLGGKLLHWQVVDCPGSVSEK
jgi:hypothetical protein